MRFSFVFILSLIFYTSVHSQVSIGKGHGYIGFKEFEKNECNLIKSKTTVFVIEDFDLQEVKEMLSKIWTLNKYIVLEKDEYEAKKEGFKNEDFITFKTNLTKSEIIKWGEAPSTSFMLSYKYFYYKVNDKKKDDKKYEFTEVARIYLSPSLDYAKQLRGAKTDFSLIEGIHNYKLGYLKNYLQIINTTLSSGEIINPFDSYHNKIKIKDLQKKTLYVPDYFSTKFQMIASSEKSIDITELFKKYNFKYELISSKELNTKILDSKEDFYYISYVNSQGMKFISVTNGLTGEIIYRDLELYSNNIKDSDLKKLNSKIQ